MDKFIISLVLSTQLMLANCALYNDGGPVLNLDQDNFNSYVLSSETAWVVEFYSSWCGHCQRFAPTYSRFAERIRAWNRIVRVGAIDCAETQHRPLCIRYNVNGYPTVKYIPQGSSAQQLGYRYTGEETAQRLTAATIDYIKATANGAHVPNTNPVRSVTEALRRLTPSTSDTYIIVTGNNQNDQNLAVEVIYDLSSFYPDLLVIRGTISDFGFAGIASSAAVYRVRRSGAMQFVQRASSRTGLASVIRQDRQVQSETTPRRPTTQIPTTILPTEIWYQYNPPDGVHSQDLDSNIYFTLWNEIPRVSLTGNALLAASGYIDILARYFSGSAHVHRFLEKVNRWLMGKQHGDIITAEEWIAALDSMQEKEAYVVPELEWVGCAGSEERYRGYPCSLWTQFHSLTVSAYLKEGQEGGEFDPIEVLQSIRSYIRHFFGCRFCANHFDRMAQNVDREVSTAYDGITWLWRAHNQVNVRIGNDSTTDPSQAKVQFPVESECPQCHAYNGWAENHVLLYLIRFYRESNVIRDSRPANETFLSGLPDPEREVVRRECVPIATQWSECSVSCDTGFSSRMSNDNDQCETKLEFRLCYLRPCNVWFPNRYNRNYCPSTYQAPPSKLKFASCETAEDFPWKYCGECGRQCCTPDPSTTREVDVVCEEDGQMVRGKVNVEIIEMCKCGRC